MQAGNHTPLNTRGTFRLVPYYSLIQRIAEKIPSSTISNHLFKHIFMLDSGLRTSSSWKLMGSSFKTPARVAKTLGDTHDQLRHWVNTIIYSDNNKDHHQNHQNHHHLIIKKN